MIKWLILILFGVNVGNMYAGEMHPLDHTSWTIINAQKLGDQVKLENVTIDNPKRLLPAVSWGENPSGSIALELDDRIIINEFEQAKFTLSIRTEQALPLKRMVLRVKDNTGEIFQIAPNKGGKLQPGLNQIHYTLDATDPQKTARNIWGGNKDKKLDWPVLVQGIAVDTDPQTPPNQKVILDSLEIQYSGEHVEFIIHTGHKFNLLLPERKAPPLLLVRNIGDHPLELSGTITIRDAGSGVCTENVSGNAPVDGELKIPLPGDYSQQNCWKIDCKLTCASGKVFTGSHRFARMNPAGPTQGRAKEFLFGLCGQPPYATPMSIEKEAEATGLCGAKIIRVDFLWTVIQLHRDKWNFTIHDKIVDANWRNGVEMQAIFDFSVPWAVAPELRPQDPKARMINLFPDPKAYANLAREVVSRYKDRIKYYETWNEPDIKHFANFPAESYMELQRSAYDAIKKIQPDAKVMNAGIARTWYNRVKDNLHNAGVLDQLIADGGKHFDLFAFHGHGSFASFVDELNILRDEYKLIGPQAPRPWYSNETAVSSTQIGDRKQAAILFQKLLYAWSEGAMGYNWYVLRHREQKRFPPIKTSAECFEMITPNFEPRPVYVTYNMLANTYKDGKFLQRLNFTPGIYACLFENPAQEGLLALWGDRIAKTLWVTGLPAGTRKIDLFGNEQPLQIQNGIALLPVSDEPFSLRIPEIHKQNIQCAGEAFAGNLPRQLVVPAGGAQTLTVKMRNPLKQALNLNIQTEATEKLSVTPTNFYETIPAGKIKPLQIQLSADSAFHATPLNPGSLKLSFSTTGLKPDAIASIPVITRTSEDEPLFQLYKEEQYYSFIASAPGNEPWYWKGPADLSAKVFLTRNQTNLQLKIEVQDDVHVQPFQGADVWKGDNVQLALQLPEQNGFWKFGLTRLANGKSEVFCWNHPQGFSDSVTGIQLDTKRDENQKLTIYNATIPFKAIGMTPEVATEGFRFNLIINDNDDNQREGFIFAMPGLGTGTNEPSLWSVISL